LVYLYSDDKHPDGDIRPDERFLRMLDWNDAAIAAAPCRVSSCQDRVAVLTTDTVLCWINASITTTLATATQSIVSLDQPCHGCSVSGVYVAAQFASTLKVYLETSGSLKYFYSFDTCAALTKSLWARRTCKPFLVSFEQGKTTVSILELGDTVQKKLLSLANPLQGACLG
jgi:hypothetical protein